jgi:cytochrome c peroxidase
VLEGISVPDIGPLPGPLPVPTGDTRHAAKIELGGQLFFDGRLSRNNHVSCAYCHIPGSGFSYPHPTSLGVNDLIGGRQAPTVLNTAFTPLLFWDGRAKSLEEQTLGPIQNPLEMAETLDHLVSKLQTIKGYRQQFQDVFGTEITPQAISEATAAFVRTLISTNSAFDR